MKDQAGFLVGVACFLVSLIYPLAVIMQGCNKHILLQYIFRLVV